MVTIKAGVMPGRIDEFVVQEGASIEEVLDIAGLSADGYDVKVDGAVIANASEAFVTADTKLVLLAQQVKGN